MAGSKKDEWNYHPDLPLRDKSLFGNIKSPVFIAKWLFKNWLSISEFVLLAVVSVVLWFFCYPSLESVKVFSFGWIFQILTINFFGEVIVNHPTRTINFIILVLVTCSFYIGVCYLLGLQKLLIRIHPRKEPKI